MSYPNEEGEKWWNMLSEKNGYSVKKRCHLGNFDEKRFVSP